jgi:TPR repeat protein
MKKSLLFFLLLQVLCSSPSLAISKKMQEAINALASLERGKNATTEEQERVVGLFREIMRKDKKPNPDAFFFIAEAYSMSVPKHLQNLETAGNYYKIALGQMPSDHKYWAKAMYNTGLCYYYKKVPTQDLNKAYEYMSIGANKENALAAMVGLFHEYGIGCEVDPSKALEFYNKTISGGGDAYAHYYQLDYFVRCITENRLDTVAYELFKNSQVGFTMRTNPYDESYLPQLIQAAEMGYLPAMFDLGALYYYDGVGTNHEENMRLAEQWLKRAADAEYIPAIYQLATLYEKLSAEANGAVTKEGYEKALPFYEKAAVAGFAPAQCAMAIYDYNGYAGLTIDKSAAKEWLQISADQGYARAKQILAKLNDLEKKERQEIRRERAQKIAEAAQAISDIINGLTKKQQKMSPSQKQRMQSSGYKQQPNTSSSDIDVTHKEKAYPRDKELLHRKYDMRVYDDYADLLMNMYYGFSIYNDRNRRDYQENMRSLRMKWEAKGMWIGSPSKWETWDGTRKK